MPPQTLSDRSGTDALLEALGDDDRRNALRVLADSGDTFSVDGLAAAIRTGDRSAESGRSGPSALSVSLYHVHLPKLAAAGLVDYDRGAREVAATGAGSLGRDLLARLDELSAALARSAAGPDGPDPTSRPGRAPSR